MSETLREDPVVIRQSQRWKWVGTVMILLLVVAFPVYKAVDSSRRTDALRSQDSALIASGAQLWGLNCASCHGLNGQGSDAPALNSQQFFEGTSNEQIAGIIRGGVPGTAMPAWWNEYGGPLTDQQVAEVVAFIRSWEKTAPSCPEWRTPACAGSAGTG
jgi:mono/diheme cytochrome c family protein